jgi:hypothetical protein
MLSSKHVLNVFSLDKGDLCKLVTITDIYYFEPNRRSVAYTETTVWIRLSFPRLHRGIVYPYQHLARLSPTAFVGDWLSMCAKVAHGTRRAAHRSSRETSSLRRGTFRLGKNRLIGS